MRKIVTLLSICLLGAGTILAQNVGIGEPNPGSKFSVKGGISIGTNYSDDAAPADGAIIEGPVAIGSTSPDPSAIIDLASSNQGVKIPSIDLSTASFPSPGPANSLLVWNNNSGFGAGVGFYYNSGSPATPTWVRLSSANNTVTTVNANSPLSSSGGNTPTISLTGTVPVSNGGTGRITLSSNSLLVGNGSSPVSLFPPSGSGNFLQWTGTNYQWTSAVTTISNLTNNPTGGLDNFTFNGSAPVQIGIANGGVDLTTKVTGILPVPNGGTGRGTLTGNGIVVGNGTSAVNQISTPVSNNTYLRWNGTAYDWVAATSNNADLTAAAGGGMNTFTYNGSSATQIGIANGGVDNGKLANDAVTSNKIQDLTITNADIANGTIDLTTKVTGVLPVTNGGTGVNTVTGVVIGNGTSAMTGIGATAGLQYLRRNSANTSYEFAPLTSTDIPDLSSLYIKNQTSVQTGANFNVGQSGVIGTSLTVGTDATVGGDVTVTGNDINGAATGASNLNVNSRGGIRAQLDSDNNGSEDFAVKNGSGTNVFTVTEAGNVSANGNGDFNGNLTLTGNSRILSSGDALDMASTSGIDVILDSDNNGTGSEFLVKKDVAGTSLFRVNEDGNTRVFNPNSPSAGGSLTVDGLSGSGTRIVTTDASGVLGAGVAATSLGTVQSVGLSLPSIFTISNSPVTTSGTLTGTFTTQTANTIFAGPTTGGAATPTFRALVAADIPNLDASKITTGILPIARGGTATGTTPGNGQLLIGNGTGYSVANISGTANQVNITNGAGTITLSTPQDIHTGASPTFSNMTVSNTTTSSIFTFPAPAGDPAPVITTRTVPAGQGASNEKTELILFHSNDPANGSGEDLITLRSPAIRLQTYNDATVGNINDNNGSVDRIYISSTGTISAYGNLEAQAGLKTRKTYKYYQNYGFTTSSNGWDNSFTTDLGTWDFCAVGQFGFKNNASNTDEDDDAQCAVYPVYAGFSSGAGEQTAYNSTMTRAYNERPNWTMYFEAFDDTNGITCAANCINFE
jgi:hypothetical protein